MVDTVAGFEQVFLTYKDVREANPSWTDEMIEDYLSLKRDLENLATISDNSENTFSLASLLPGLIQKVNDLDSVVPASSAVKMLTQRIEALEDVRSVDYRSKILIKKIDDLENARNIDYGQIALGQISESTSDIIVVTADHTTRSNEIVVCNNTVSIDVTLNATPIDRESVHVVRQNTGPVNVLGPALGDTSLTIGNRYSSPHFTYIRSISSWVVI